MARTTSLGIPAALGFYCKSLPQHLSNQLEHMKIPLNICGGWLGLWENCFPFLEGAWDPPSIGFGLNFTSTFSELILDLDGGKLKEHLTPWEEDLFVLWNVFLMFAGIKMHVPLHFEWCLGVLPLKHRGHANFIYATAAVTCHWLNHHKMFQLFPQERCTARAEVS